jgi:site-specific DNA-cytosine methylase
LTLLPLFGIIPTPTKEPPMKILVACEESQVVAAAFRARGHEAFSCDIQETSGDHPEWHIQGDVLSILNMDWDMIIAFPPCTHLASSGARWFSEKRKDGRQQEGIDFFMQFAKAKCPRIAIENPVGIMSSKYRKPDQIIQPWQFGHGETKATCLWLKGLPKLVPTNIVSGRTAYVHRLPPSADRAKLRSKTYQGIADAMAAQWG